MKAYLVSESESPNFLQNLTQKIENKAVLYCDYHSSKKAVAVCMKKESLVCENCNQGRGIRLENFEEYLQEQKSTSEEGPIELGMDEDEFDSFEDNGLCLRRKNSSFNDFSL